VTRTPIHPRHAAVILALACSILAVSNFPRTLIAQTTAPADEEVSMPATQPTADVAALIRQLADDSFPVRQAAQEKLAAMDPAIEGQLRGAIAAGLGPEANARALALADNFREQRYFGGSRITLHVKDAPLAGVLKSFTDQARAPMGTDDPDFIAAIADRKITLDLDHVDFWLAARQLADAGKLLLWQTTSHPLQFCAKVLPSQDAVDLTPLFTRSAITAGPLRIVPISGDRQSADIILQVYAEPKIHPVPAACSCIIRSCTDDQGVAHHQINQTAREPVSTWFWKNSFSVDNPNPAVTKLRLIKAEYHLAFELNHQTFDFGNLANQAGQTHVFDTHTFTVSQLTGDGTNQHLNFTVTNPPGSRATPLQLTNTKVTFGTPPCSVMLLTDKDLPVSSQFSFRNLPQSLTVMMTIAANAKPAKLRCDIAGQQRIATMSIEFDDLPLLPAPTLP
jgi:hypothetical protein